MTRRVMVIGGGLAGTAAALKLADAGASVVLLERRPQLGGMVSSFRRDGLHLDNGQHVFLRCCTEYVGLLDRLGCAHLAGLQDRLSVPVLVSYPGSSSHWAKLGRSSLRLPPPLHLTGGLLRYTALAPAARLKAATTAVALGRLDPRDPAVDGQRFGPWLRRRGVDARSAEALWGLLTVATLNVGIEDASLALAAKVVRTGLLETADGGDIGRLQVPQGEVHHVASLAALRRAGVEVHVRSAVRSLTSAAATNGPGSAGAATAGTTWTITTDDGSYAADAIVLAVPPDAAARLLPTGATVRHEFAERLGSAPIVNVHLHYDRPVLPRPFVAVLGSPVQWVFDRTHASGATSGQSVAISLSAAEEWIDRPTSELRAVFSREMARLFLGARAARLQTVVVSRERSATFRQAAGSGAYRPGPASGLPGLALAGAWTDTGWPATMEGAVRSGYAAADHVLTLGRRLPRQQTRRPALAVG
jgi:squalene-associated FAD-dependent desaturase